MLIFDFVLSFQVQERERIRQDELEYLRQRWEWNYGVIKKIALFVKKKLLDIPIELFVYGFMYQLYHLCTMSVLIQSDFAWWRLPITGNIQKHVADILLKALCFNLIGQLHWCLVIVRYTICQINKERLLYGVLVHPWLIHGVFV